MPLRSYRSFICATQPPTYYSTGFVWPTSHGLPYVVEVEYDGSAIFRQPAEMDFTPASNVLSRPLTGRLRPRHFAGESAHEPLAVSLLDSTMSKGEVQRVIFLFREIYFECRSRLGECHLAPKLRPVPHPLVYCFVRITPSPIVLRRRSGYFARAFSACSLVLKGFDSGVNSRPTYLNSSHCSTIFGIPETYSTTAVRRHNQHCSGSSSTANQVA